ncbi:MAG: glycosyltransferase [Planctomycetota bacterium]|nr:glycosyltransferase [Planctomycetota bacterium]
MSRTRCSGALVDALREHGLQVRWRNLVKWRRWFGRDIEIRLARREFHRYRPDLVFVFSRDLAPSLLAEFRKSARVVIWCEDSLEDLDSSYIDYFRQADLVCISNPERIAWLQEHGLANVTFLLSGFSPAYHRPLSPQAYVRDVAYIGGPGRKGQRAEFLHKVTERFDTEVFGLHWDRWTKTYPGLRCGGQVKPRRYARICATSRIVLGTNQVNDDTCYFSNRTFLTLACGGFHLTHYVPQLERVFTNGEHLGWFRNEDEALDLIEHWLAREDERRRVAAAGHDLVVRHHRYFHRVARILQILREGLPTDPTVGLGQPDQAQVASVDRVD